MRVWRKVARSYRSGCEDAVGDSGRASWQGDKQVAVLQQGLSTDAAQRSRSGAYCMSQLGCTCVIGTPHASGQLSSFRPRLRLKSGLISFSIAVAVAVAVVILTAWDAKHKTNQEKTKLFTDQARRIGFELCAVLWCALRCVALSFSSFRISFWVQFGLYCICSKGR